MDTAGGLGGFSILDVSTTIAGAYCSRLLASYGAEVLKIEDPNGGDPVRHVGPFAGDDPQLEKSLLFHYLNTGKRGITLNLHTPLGVTLFKKLVQKADAVVEDLGAGEIERLGLGYAVLEEITPKLVMISISPFGQTGPYSHYKAPQLVRMAISGRSYNTGEDGKPPLNLGGNLGEYMAGVMGAVGAAVALYDAEVSGQGQYIDLSAAATDHFTGSGQVVRYSYTGSFEGRTDPAAQNFGRFEGTDGYLGVHILGMPGMIEGLSRLFDMPELLDPNRPTDMVERRKWNMTMSPKIAERVRNQSVQELFYKAMRMRLPFGLFNTTKDLVENYPPFQERGFFVEVEHPVTGKEVQPGAPFLMGAEEDRFRVTRPAPTLGQHNVEVYGDLGYSKEELRSLREHGAI